MEVKHWTVGNYQYKEIMSRQYYKLLMLGNEYTKKGAKVWINNFDMCEGQWILTVMEEKSAAA